MSSEAVRAIIEAKLTIGWAATTPITWDNVDRIPTPGTDFIACLMSCVNTETKGLTCQRESYIVTIEVYTPHGEGTTGNMVLADTLTAMFFNYISGNLTVNKVRTERIGDKEEWHQRNVIIELTYDHFF